MSADQQPQRTLAEETVRSYSDERLTFLYDIQNERVRNLTASLDLARAVRSDLAAEVERRASDNGPQQSPRQQSSGAGD